MRVLKYRKTDRAGVKGQKRHAKNAERVKIHVTAGDAHLRAGRARAAREAVHEDRVVGARGDLNESQQIQKD